MTTSTRPETVPLLAEHASPWRMIFDGAFGSSNDQPFSSSFKIFVLLPSLSVMLTSTFPRSVLAFVVKVNRLLRY